MDTERAKQILTEYNRKKSGERNTTQFFDRVREFFRQGQVTLPDLIEFTNAMHALYRAGFTIQSSLELLDENVSHPKLKDVMQEMAVTIQAGNSLAEALEKHTDIFPGFYINNIRAAEKGGIVENALKHLAEHLKRKHRRLQMIRRWFLYPNLVFKLILGGALLLAVLHEILQSNLRNVMVVGTVVCSWYLGKDMFKALIRSGKGKQIWDAVRIKEPVFRPVLIAGLNYQFANQFLPMYNAGVRIDKIFHLLGDASTNGKYGDGLKAVSYRLEQGETLEHAIQYCPYFSGELRVHLRTGERTGNYTHSLQAFLAQQNRRLPALIKGRARALYILYLGILLFLLTQMINLFVGGYFEAVFP